MEFTFENIQNSIEQADEFLENNGIDRKCRLQYRLFLEEQLIVYRERGMEHGYELKLRKRGKFISVKLIVKGDACDLTNSEDAPITAKLMSEFEAAPIYKYRHGKNVITYAPVALLPNFRNQQYVWTYMLREKKSFFWAVAFRMITMALMVVEPVLSALIIVAYSGSEINRILLAAVLLLIQSATSAFCQYLGNFLLRRSYAEMLKEMQIELAAGMLEIKTERMDENGNGVFTQRLLDETKSAVYSIDALVASGCDIFRLVSLLISFAIISVPMLFFELMLFGVFILIQYLYHKNLSEDDRRFRTVNEQHVSFVGEMVRAHRDIKLLHSEGSFLEKLNSRIERSIDVETKMRVKSMQFILLRTEFVNVTNFIYMALLALLMVTKGMAPSTALILFNYNGRIYSCSNLISAFMDAMYQMGISAERIYQLMHSRDFERDTFGSEHLSAVQGGIELRNVHFSYKHGINRVRVLKGLTLRIQPGESVAFIGRSGCGKTTILSMIARLYDPDQGDVLLDGIPLPQLDKETVRSNITMVSQSPYIFNMSIRENFEVVKKNLTDEEMVEACKLACIYDDIMQFPNRFDTVMGEGGIQISGGQRQRLALARALLTERPVIMLDEATSALDNVTQMKIRRAIENLKGKRTVIMVAHRLSTVINCERLFFIADGRVIAEGTHSELLKNCKEYRELYSEETNGES